MVTMGLTSRMPIVLATAVFTAIAQPAPGSKGPHFEVVSIRPVPADAPPLLRPQEFTAILPGGQ